ncbi:hypothetical protein AVEN_128913-1 [Araneus ventricosus]|uniref:Uncharacterized protein n=1 Tax=Araneus ventricosus TaxID=182803 RepID=A0A4Y2X3C8_ARAVE|nr:hypothetical protein AVEN_128913-1 [Araneus ventricosus]
MFMASLKTHYPKQHPPFSLLTGVIQNSIPPSSVANCYPQPASSLVHSTGVIQNISLYLVNQGYPNSISLVWLIKLSKTVSKHCYSKQHLLSLEHRGYSKQHLLVQHRYLNSIPL